MKRVAIAAVVTVAGMITVAAAGPLDFLKGASKQVPGGNKVAGHIDTGAKLIDAASLDTAERRNAVGQTVTLGVTAHYRGLDDRDRLQAYVTLVGLAVARVADPAESKGKYVFGVLNSDESTACSGPGGYVMITRGALAMMDDEAELAGVLAHEIAHVYKNHGIDALKTAKLADLGTSVATAADRNVAAFNAASDNLIKNALTKKYSREQEIDADKLAVQFVEKAGYDGNGYARFLRKIEGAKGAGGAFSTHPGSAERAKVVERLVSGRGVTAAERFRKMVKGE